jgi:histidinol phosphatase-like enzyme (inositol monophosphatase family)
VESSELRAFALTLADAARQHTLRYFRQGMAVEHKPDESPVTIADRETEQQLRTLLANHYPEHGIYGEEFANELSDQRLVWVIDPIDGTKSFISGVPTFGTLIALLEDNRPLLGLIDMPALNERWIGQHGHETLFNGQVCHTRAVQTLAEATLFATAPEMFQGADAGCFDALAKRVRLRRFGGDCYAYGLLAAGFIDLVVEADLKPFDYCALINIIHGAGGIISDWDGKPLGLHSDGRVIAAANAALHQQALKVLAEGAP